MTDSIDVRALLDADIAATLAASPLDLSMLSVDLLPMIRGAASQLPPAKLSDAVIRTDHQVPQRPEVTVRVHRPAAAGGARGCLYWIHGGGYVMGSYTMDDRRLEHWCTTLDCVAVAVEYRLAPESPFPIPLEDCYAGLRWTFDHAAELGIDPGRIGIGGSSAGGGLAAGLGLLARDRGELPVAFQLLVYPMIDDRSATVSSQWDDPVWPPVANQFGWASYLRGLDGDVPYHAAPARAFDLAGLPPTLVTVGALDILCDEGVDYATRLRHAGVPTELHVYPGAPHGFDSMAPGSAVSRRARRHVDEWLAAQQ